MQDWMEQVLDGGIVVVSIKASDRMLFGELLEWSDHQSLYVYIGRHVRHAEGRNPYMRRPYDWGNPFSLAAAGSREVIMTRFEHEYLPSRPDLLARLPELRGKVLGCWCAPEPCHGDILARLAS